MSKISTHNNAPNKMPPKKKPPFEQWTVLVFSFGTGVMMFLAMLNLLPPDGFMGVFKAVVISGSATLVSYAVNRFAIEKGAELAATGFATAGVVSVISILAVGMGLFPSTYAGLVINDVDELQIHSHVSEKIHFIGARNKIASEAARIIPAVRVNEAELIQYRDCEFRESCLSNHGNGGRGSVTKILEERARRAGTIADQLEAGEAARQSILSQINSLIGDFQKEFGQTDKSLKERRPKLIRLDAEIDQMVSALDEALPVSILRAYVGELESGVSIPSRPVATKRLNAILKKHALGLSSVLSSLETGEQTQPVFPPRAGVSTTFAYMGHFLPIAALTACVELIFPLTLWIYTLLALIWIKHQADLRNREIQASQIGSDGHSDSDSDDGVNNITNLPTHNPRHRRRGSRNQKRGG